MASLLSPKELKPIKLVLSLLSSRLLKSFLVLVQMIFQSVFGHHIQLTGLILLGIELA